MEKEIAKKKNQLIFKEEKKKLRNKGGLNSWKHFEK